MPRRYRSPDGHDWRDPDMPVIRDYRFGDGSKKTIVDQAYEHRYREMLMQTTAHPSFRLDPTYNLRRKPNV